MGPLALVHLEDEDYRCLKPQRKMCRLPIKQTTHDVRQITQTSKTIPQDHKETEHDVAPQGYSHIIQNKPSIGRYASANMLEY